ncbi:hypothetical protein PV05_10090 [Exophiala xenobiotica]|uniref:Uncharacterized protein n=1 Tax=Exophiala xenobiotica TaxID=348802 RepID=A0A0D2E9M5_9EURO|nr:uncharacterized protein PV05_10090 [Exophiala xenobiotica]KIW51360.1 hypothetical protein PV05_10090 [Exophiala xenobiotica]
MLLNLFRRSRSIRVPLKNGNFDMQRVSVKRRPKPIVSRVLSTILISYCVLQTAHYVLPKKDSQSNVESQLKTLQSQVKRLEDKNETSDSQLQHDGDFRVWLPWMRHRKPPMYTPDDPDWREYQKLQQDEKLMTRIKVQVVGMIVQTALPEYASSLFAVGANQNRIHMNLDIIPPVRPPTIYEISCLYFGPDRCTWGWHQLPDNIGSKVQHIFHPFVFREAFYAGLKEFARIFYKISRARVADFYDSVRDQTTRAGSKIEKGAKHAKDTTQVEKVQSQLWINQISDKSKDQWLPFLRGECSDHPSTQSYRDVVKSVTYQQAIEAGCMMFRSTVNSGRALTAGAHVRDAVRVEGSLVWYGTKGKLHLDVRAVYSPENGSIIGKPVVLRAYTIPDTTKWHNKKQSDPATKLPTDKTGTQSPLKQSKETSGGHQPEPSTKEREEGK